MLAIALELFFAGGGIYFLQLGIRNGIIRRSIEQLGRVHTGPMAVIIGIYSVILGLGGLFAFVFIAWAWCRGKLLS